MRLLVNEPQQTDAAMMETLNRAASLCIRGEGIDPERIEVSLSFVEPEEIHRLNREFRGVDRVTDVLSFPLAEDLDELPGLEEAADTGRTEAPAETDGEAMPEEPAGSPEEGAGTPEETGDIDDDWFEPLGDVVICLDRAEAQAEEYGHSREREIVYLFVHSILHLLGYDHMEPEEQRLMRAREEEVMEALDLRRTGG